MKLTVNNMELTFREVKLTFNSNEFVDVFANKNNKSLVETISHNRYTKHKDTIMSSYSDYLNLGLGRFLLELKSSGDLYYKEFLNKNGDKTYSEFYIDDNQVKKAKGLYLYCVDKQVKYIGRCKDAFGKRINQGYGKIHPKNCYIDGQSTNCHLNNLVTINKENTSFYVCQLIDDSEIVELEEELIKKYKPEWNISLKSS
ncbi:hypothetical protein [Paenibacillus vini]|uniref:GIY-YIG domain-containing protein n=1 Tax=Paenibacillus vini TaxID=1476024 RepID=A0ABQ4MB91_9BACL|nr:hypothetical protein [Paenibacillus vini]GIP52917.1 hypothetical protein J42TS3_19520 [Paenibacillus vini]